MEKAPYVGSNPYKWRAWKKLRRSHLASSPLCVRCLEEGRTTPATDVDHVKPWRGDLEAFFAGPFQSLCKSCHGAKSSREDRDDKPRKGCDVNGDPLAGW